MLDGAPIRRKARREYEKVLRELDQAKAEAERFESQDKPQFSKWISANFGALLTELRELQEKLYHTQELVNEVQQEFYYGNYRSIHNAYKKVMRRRNAPDEISAEEKAAAEAEEAELRRDFEEIFNEAAQEFWEKMGVNPEEPAAPRKGTKPRPASRLKELYRRLVRLLHPDKGARRTPREIEWWHQTQAAYQSQNVEQLELILTLIEIEQRGSTDASVSVLAQLTLEFKKSLKALKRQLSGFKQDVAWNFSQLVDFSGLMRRTRIQLESERDHILWLLQKYERQIATWQTATATPAKRTRTRSGSYQDEEWF